MAKLTQEGPDGRAGGDRGTHHRPHVLGQGVVRQPGKLPRLREPPAARAHLCAQRLGGRSADRAARGDGDGQRLVDLPRHGEHRRGGEGALAVDLQGLRRRDRFAGRAAAGPAVARRDGAHLPPGPRAVSRAEGDPLHVQLPGLRVDVQARRGGAVRRRRAAGCSSRNCCSGCARWTRRIWWPASTRRCR